MIGSTFYARLVAPRAGFLLAFDQAADYASPNFLWFRQRWSRFVYVDRIAIAKSARGLGLASLLYFDLFEQSRAAGHERITCEVNIDPPNPASDAFHTRLDFTEVGRAKLSNGKSIRYLTRAL